MLNVNLQSIYNATNEIFSSNSSPLASTESCTGQDLADLGERLRDWFQLLQTNAKQNNNSKRGARTTAASTTSGQTV